MGQCVGVRPHDSPLNSPGTARWGAAAWRAATLDERLAATAGPGATPGGAESRARVGRWMRLFAGGDAASFDRRLGWDGLTMADVERALDDQPPPAFDAAWTKWLPALGDEMAASAGRFRSPEWEAHIADLAGTPAVPFADAWLPWVRVARAAIESGLERPERLALPAWRSVERQLLADLALTSEAVMLESLRARVAHRRAAEPGPALSTGVYDDFIRGWLADGLSGLVDQYAALARQLVWLLATAVEGTVEWATRLEADRDVLAAVLAVPITTVADVALGLSDRHDGGRTVVLLQVDQGRRLVYKPRDLRLDAAYHGLLSWLREAGLDAVPSPLRVVVRDGYGWIEYAEQSKAWERVSVQAYYRRAGGLLCVAYLLGARDLHGENVVASAEGPTLVDVEALIQPVRSPDDDVEMGGHRSPTGADGRDEPAECCLATGLLTLRHVDAAGEYYDIGGLREPTPRTAETGRAVWYDLRTDQIRCETDRVVRPAYLNAVRTAGSLEPPERYLGAVLAGFERTYRFLLQHRDRLGAAEGPLARFGDATTRVLFRSSDRYSALLHVLRSPAHWRSGVDRSIALDTLNRVFSREPTRPELWPLVGDERRALECGDLPRFGVPTTACDLVSSSGERVDRHFARSGMDAVRHRLREMCPADLARQLAWIRAALMLATGLADGGSAPSSQSPARDRAEDRHVFVGAAERLGRDLMPHAVRSTEGGLEWPVLGPRLDLYGGAVGVGLFFAALARVRGAEWRAPALEALAGVRRAAADGGWRTGLRGVGGGAGIGSAIYALTVSSTLVEAPDLLGAALDLASALDRPALQACGACDVVSGLAGALLALLNLYQRTGDASVVERATAAATRLLDLQVETAPGQGAWRSPDGRLRAGFAHGASGIAYALARAAGPCRLPAAIPAVTRALAWERSVFSPLDRNWPSLRGDGGTAIMTAWCHGAAGVGLARVLTRDLVADPLIDEDLRVALDTTARAGASRFDHLCCGTLARAEALLAAGTRLARVALADGARRLARPIADRIVESGLAGARVADYEFGMLQPGFFQGASGVGYQLLRMVHPATLPSVAGFECPTEVR
jgi:type 2 lantibiotic biosynthesis protein LanM